MDLLLQGFLENFTHNIHETPGSGVCSAVSKTYLKQTPFVLWHILRSGEFYVDHSGICGHNEFNKLPITKYS